MSAVANLVLKNASDVNVNYYPFLVRTGDEVAWVDRTASTLNEQSKARLFFKESATTRRVSGKITLPYVDTFNAEKTHTAIANFEFVLPLNANATTRTEIRKRLVAMIADAVITAAVENGETPW